VKPGSAPVDDLGRRREALSRAVGHEGDAGEVPVDGGAQRPVVIVASVIFGLVILLLGAAIVVTYLAYDRQATRVDVLDERTRNVAAENREIAGAQAAIRSRFVAQSRSIDAAIRTARSSYDGGFADGRRAQRLPAQLAPIGRYVARGFLVPLELPVMLRYETPRIGPQGDGYVLRWSNNMALFASKGEPLRVWTRQAWPGARRQVRIGARQVTRLVGPSGVVHAWREGGRTYAVQAPRRLEELSRGLVRAMR